MHIFSTAHLELNSLMKNAGKVATNVSCMGYCYVVTSLERQGFKKKYGRSCLMIINQSHGMFEGSYVVYICTDVHQFPPNFEGGHSKDLAVLAEARTHNKQHQSGTQLGHRELICEK